MTATATTTKPATENICRWVEGKDVARNAIECGSVAFLAVTIGEQTDYYSISRDEYTGGWLVGKEVQPGEQPKFYRVNLEWSQTECTCDSCLWGRRKQMKIARLECKPIEKLFECKHIKFVRNALKSIGIEG